MANLMITDVFDIFNDIFKDLVVPSSKDEVNEETLLNGVDMANVSKEELDKVMNSLKKMKDNDVLAYILGDEYIDKLMGEIQARWDIANEEPKENAPGLPVDDKNERVDNQIEKLVDEYMDGLGVSDQLKSNYLIQHARDSYINFAKFIYNHD